MQQAPADAGFFMPDIFVPQNPQLHIDRRRTLPSPGDLSMRCGRCGRAQFHVHVTPLEPTARVREIVCARCQTVYRLDLVACLEKGGKPEQKSNGSFD